MTRTWLWVLVAMVVASGTAEKVLFKDCGSVDGLVKDVDVTPCPTEPCVFHHNTTSTIAIDFVSKVNTSGVTAVVAGIIDDVPIPFPISKPDACQSGVKCPVKAGDENEYKYGMFVDPSYPKIKVVIKYELKDDGGKDLVCILMPAEIED